MMAAMTVANWEMKMVAPWAECSAVRTVPARAGSMELKTVEKKVYSKVV
jgi:hypothetical protein